MRPKFAPHVHYHAHPGVEGHEHEHPLVGHHYAPFGNRVIQVPDAEGVTRLRINEEPSLVLLLKKSIEAERKKRGNGNEA